MRILRHRIETAEESEFAINIILKKVIFAINE